MTSSMRQLAFLFAFIATLLLDEVRAQRTDAQCLSQYDWMTNSRGQNPCLVSAYLVTPCLTDPAAAIVQPLPPDSPGDYYRPPQPASATACQCNTVFYSMLQACSKCQAHPIVPWSTWEFNCTTPYSGYPETIPSGTNVPSWAYLDVIRADAFNDTAAKANHDEGLPESTSPSSPESTGSTSTSTSPTSAPTGAPAAAVRKVSHAGAIAGGVVGGIVGLAIAAALALFLWRRHQRRHALRAAPASNFILDHDEKGFPDIPSTTPVSHSVGFPVSNKLYDPNDPTTFPPTEPEATLTSTTAVASTNQSMIYSRSDSPFGRPSPGQYRGAPEL
ncbi:hypothetical protein BXZ70DRAFT_195533 [Cristinia sonorae]|uniref:Uncharacterized protein n=1 Tax=Cristinia sonorae TaxID=1940300 RepID=A0A8K0UPL4_9AGAR|nr:hypothetical protein BXZ70DRAFT_195533 [Cristinia sonorae]